MLRKLLKYELKATARTFLPLYGCLILFAVINRVFVAIQDRTEHFSFFFGVSLTSYIFLIVAIFALTVFVMIQRFYKSLLGDEGYLMFTLPTTPGKLILSKLIISIFWVVVSIAITGFSIMILAMSTGFWQAMGQLFQALGLYFREYFSFADVSVLTSFLFLGLCGLTYLILSVYCAIAVGHSFKQHRAIGSVGAYLVICLISQVATTLCVQMGGFFTTRLPSLEHLLLYEKYGISLFLLFFAVMYLIFAAVCYVVTQQLLSKRLNLA